MAVRKHAKIKVLHLASFSGNIGDNASHKGLHRIFEELGVDAQFTELEIRYFYKNAQPPFKRKFDTDFVHLCNQYDLVIWGGGGYMDFWVPDSATGTTFDCTLDLISEIKVPLLITSVGCYAGKPIPEGNEKKFTSFLEYCAKAENIEIFFRNDGSKNRLKHLFGEELAAPFPEILDNGFFYQNENKLRLPVKREYVALNVAFDQLGETGPGSKTINATKFFREVRHLIQFLISEQGYDVCLVPHIPDDLRGIVEILNDLPNKLARENITIAPLLSGWKGADYIFDIYAAAALVIGNRFHTNVCSLAMRKKTIGLSAMNRISAVFESVGLSEYCIDLDLENWLSATRELVYNTLEYPKDRYSQLITQSLTPKEFQSKYHYQNYLKTMSERY